MIIKPTQINYIKNQVLNIQKFKNNPNTNLILLKLNYLEKQAIFHNVLLSDIDDALNYFSIEEKALIYYAFDLKYKFGLNEESIKSFDLLKEIEVLKQKFNFIIQKQERINKHPNEILGHFIDKDGDLAILFYKHTHGLNLELPSWFKEVFEYMPNSENNSPISLTNEIIKKIELDNNKLYTKIDEFLKSNNIKDFSKIRKTESAILLLDHELIPIGYHIYNKEIIESKIFSLLTCIKAKNLTDESFKIIATDLYSIYKNNKFFSQSEYKYITETGEIKYISREDLTILTKSNIENLLYITLTILGKDHKFIQYLNLIKIQKNTSEIEQFINTDSSITTNNKKVIELNEPLDIPRSIFSDLFSIEDSPFKL